MSDPDLIRFVEAQISVRHRTFGASPHPGATIFLLRIEGASARFFWVVFGDCFDGGDQGAMQLWGHFRSSYLPPC